MQPKNSDIEINIVAELKVDGTNSVLDRFKSSLNIVAKEMNYGSLHVNPEDGVITFLPLVSQRIGGNAVLSMACMGLSEGLERSEENEKIAQAIANQKVRAALINTRENTVTVALRPSSRTGEKFTTAKFHMNEEGFATHITVNQYDSPLQAGELKNFCVKSKGKYHDIKEEVTLAFLTR